MAGRFVSEKVAGTEPGQDEQQGEAGVKSVSRPRAPRAKYCRNYTRKRIAEALPRIVERFTEEAKKGSIQHMKVLTKLGGLDENVMPTVTKRRPKSVVGRLLDDLFRDKPETVSEEAIAEEKRVLDEETRRALEGSPEDAVQQQIPFGDDN